MKVRCEHFVDGNKVCGKPATHLVLDGHPPIIGSPVCSYHARKKYTNGFLTVTKKIANGFWMWPPDFFIDVVEMERNGEA